MVSSGNESLERCESYESCLERFLCMLQVWFIEDANVYDIQCPGERFP